MNFQKEYIFVRQDDFLRLAEAGEISGVNLPCLRHNGHGYFVEGANGGRKVYAHIRMENESRLRDILHNQIMEDALK